MAPSDTFGFNEKAYAKKLRRESDSDLYEKHHEKVKHLAGKGTSLAITLGAAGASGGLTLLGAGYSVRQMDVVDQKKDLIERELIRRGLYIPRSRKRDMLQGATFSLATGGITHGHH